MVSLISGLVSLGSRRFRSIVIAFAIFNVLVICAFMSSYTDVGVEWATYYNFRNLKGNTYIEKLYQKMSYNRTHTLYPLPEDIGYDDLTSHGKIQYLLNDVASNKTKYWLAHTELTDYKIKIDPTQFSKEACKDKVSLFFDPRFTFSVVLNEIKRQYLAKNKDNQREKVEDIRIPFSWSDWVDLTDLNPYILDQHKIICSTLAKEFNQAASNPNYCKTPDEITEEELKNEIGLPSRKFLPGFSVKDSPQTIAPNKVRILEAKSHLLTYAFNPINIIFLTKNGTYEAFVSHKQRIVDSDMFEDYLKLKNYRGGQDLVVMDPVQEFIELLELVPADTTSADDPYGMVKALKESGDMSTTSEVHIPEDAFNYQQKDIDTQILEYERTGNFSNTISLDRQHQDTYYEGLKLANTFSPKKEQMYFKLARLKIDAHNPKDHGWHYEWRFFNGALRYVKPGWTEEDMLYREKIILDRILKNWFSFAKERGILSWISHGPLLSWYWDGLLFPFDEDIDIQMPAKELARFLLLYNQTLVVEDMVEGFGKFFIDCGTYLHHRGRSYNDNHIDARFIDVDSGSYIDITGLGVSDERLPDKFKEMDTQGKIKSEKIIEELKKSGKYIEPEKAATTENENEEKKDKRSVSATGEYVRPVYNCRNVHFYSYDEIQPLRLTSIANIPCFAPQKIDAVLHDEYSRGVTKYEYMKWYFIDRLNLWVHRDKFKHYLDPFLDLTDEDEVTRQVQNMNDDQILGLLEDHRELLLEYYLTKDLTSVHRAEMSYLFENQRGVESTIGQLGKQRPGAQINENMNYRKLRQEFTFKASITRPLYNFEYIDRKKNIAVENEEREFVRQRDITRRAKEVKILKEKDEIAAKEKAEKEAKEKAEKIAKEKLEKEAKAKSEKEAKEAAEKEAKQKAENEAKVKAEKEAKEKAEKEAKDKERAEQEAKKGSRKQ